MAGENQLTDELKQIIARRIATHPEYDYGIQQCWDEAITLIKNNQDEAINFIKHEGSDEEVYWLSEILCDIYDVTFDERFVDAFKERGNNMSDAEMKRSVLQEVGHV